MPEFKTSYASVKVKSGAELLEIGRKHPELKLKFGCTRGDCGVCAVKVCNGSENLTKRSRHEAETLERTKKPGAEWRLACQCAINGDVSVSN